MSPSTETVLDFDRSVTTEDRFAIRRFLDTFVVEVNTGNKDTYAKKISDAVVIEGFSDFTMLKENFVGILARKFIGSAGDFIRFPKLSLSYSHFMFSLSGTYEEFIDSILVTEGTIDIQLMKQDEQFLFVAIHFFPRMMLTDGMDL